MVLWKAIILGIVQGLTEFLPISSSGHLALFNKLFSGGEADVQFFAIVHLGTMLATVCVFCKDIEELVKSLIHVPKALKLKTLDNNLRMCIYIIIASIPTGFMGIFLNDKFEYLANNINIIGSMLIITGIILYLTKIISIGEKNESNFGYMKALFAGIAQGLAIMPGISRSGMTISAILFLKGERGFAGKFSFLMSLPAIFAANMLEFSKAGISSLKITDFVGLVVSFLVGFIALKFLLELVRKGKFYYFAYYCVFVGIVSIIFI